MKLKGISGAVLLCCVAASLFDVPAAMALSRIYYSQEREDPGSFIVEGTDNSLSSDAFSSVFLPLLHPLDWLQMEADARAKAEGRWLWSYTGGCRGRSRQDALVLGDGLEPAVTAQNDDMEVQGMELHMGAKPQEWTSTMHMENVMDQKEEKGMRMRDSSSSSTKEMVGSRWLTDPEAVGALGRGGAHSLRGGASLFDAQDDWLQQQLEAVQREGGADLVMFRNARDGVRSSGNEVDEGESVEAEVEQEEEEADNLDIRPTSSDRVISLLRAWLSRDVPSSSHFVPTPGLRSSSGISRGEGGVQQAIESLDDAEVLSEEWRNAAESDGSSLPPSGFREQTLPSLSSSSSSDAASLLLHPLATMSTLLDALLPMADVVGGRGAGSSGAEGGVEGGSDPMQLQLSAAQQQHSAMMGSLASQLEGAMRASERREAVEEEETGWGQVALEAASAATQAEGEVQRATAAASTAAAAAASDSSTATTSRSEAAATPVIPSLVFSPGKSYAYIVTSSGSVLTHTYQSAESVAKEQGNGGGWWWWSRPAVPRSTFTWTYKSPFTSQDDPDALSPSRNEGAYSEGGYPGDSERTFWSPLFFSLSSFDFSLVDADGNINWWLIVLVLQLVGLAYVLGTMIHTATEMRRQMKWARGDDMEEEDMEEGLGVKGEQGLSSPLLLSRKHVPAGWKWVPNGEGAKEGKEGMEEEGDMLRLEVVLRGKGGALERCFVLGDEEKGGWDFELGDRGKGKGGGLEWGGKEGGFECHAVWAAATQALANDREVEVVRGEGVQQQQGEVPGELLAQPQLQGEKKEEEGGKK